MTFKGVMMLVLIKKIISLFTTNKVYYTYMGIFETKTEAHNRHQIDEYVNEFQNNRDYEIYLNSDFSFYQRHSLVPTFVAGLAKSRVRILDIGAGYFSCFHYLKRSLPNTQVEVVAIERSVVVEKIGEQPKEGLFYFDSIDKVENKKFDIIYFGSSYQYFFEELEEDVNKYMSLNATYVIIADTRFAETHESFITIQCNMQPSLFAQRINNLSDTLKKFLDAGYQLIYISKRKSEPHDTLPERELNARELIFKKSPKEYNLKNTGT